MRRLLTITATAGLAMAAPATAHVTQWGELVAAHSTPTAVAHTGSSVRVVASNSFAMSLEADGVLNSWGKNSQHQLGNGKDRPSETARPVLLPEGAVWAVGEAENAGFASVEGQVYAWGANSNDETCGLNRTKIPLPIAGLTGVTAIAGGADHVLFLKEGQVYGCGDSKQGQLGLGRVVKLAAEPTLVPIAGEAVELTAGNQASEVRTATGAVYGFGPNAHGQTGVGLRAQAVYTPTMVPLPGPASEVSEGGDLPGNGFGVALVEGVPYAWGENAGGQLGDGTATSSKRPVVMSTLTSFALAQLVAGGAEYVALTSEGEVYTGGGGTGYVLGNGSLDRSLEPIPVLSGQSEVSATAKVVVAR